MTTLLPFLWVAIGGAAGAMTRYGLTLTLIPQSSHYMVGTLAANLLGCFIIGIVAQFAALTSALSNEMRLLLATGFCGGFTTLSSLILELSTLLKANQPLTASWYFCVTLLGAFISFYLGSCFIKLLLVAK